RPASPPRPAPVPRPDHRRRRDPGASRPRPRASPADRDEPGCVRARKRRMRSGDIEAPQPVVADAPVATSSRGLERRVLGLAAPVIGENLLQTMLGVVDTILVAGLGAVALAGVGAALQVIFVIIAALRALSVGASVLVAQAFGAGDLKAASRF